ncbi:MAG: pyruvate dehydrogenase (acetyl-transferring) E1 component subunit alpha [Solirubrobacterales bacterium]|nr:pyruvate dehydrogenase (acetyl-transferring) E1 component subunit alpha [Solirubrobacterales bacterium]
MNIEGDTVNATTVIAERPTPARILAPDGTVPEGYRPPLSEQELLMAYRLMLLSRRVDERAFNLQRQGRLGTFSPVHGQEAAVVGSACALDPARDWVVPQYRELPAMLRQGYTLERFFLYFKGNPEGNRMPDGVNLLPYQISLATQLPHAVGLAWGLRHQRLDGVVCVYFGDGASSEGDFHEACNLAGVRRAPVIFLLQNNGWAISTPVSKQTAAESFAARAAGYGFPGELVDGNDFFAVYEATARAVTRARAGEGPTLIEALTYRMGPHNTADDPSRYVDQRELEEHRPLDPIARLHAYLEDAGILRPGARERIRGEIELEVEEALRAAEARAQARPEQIFDHVYAQPPGRVEAQRRALME